MKNKKKDLYGEGARSEWKTWLGIDIQVTLGPGFIHNVGIGPFNFPHPPVANYILRRGISTSGKYELGFAHEFAHFQTFPAAAVYAMFIFSSLKDIGSNVRSVSLALASFQAFWEAVSELRTFSGNRKYYLENYRGVSLLPRFVFWISAIAISSCFWIARARLVKINNNCIFGVDKIGE